MHELAICQALLDELERLARERHAQRVLSAAVRIGPLAGVDPQLLRSAYAVACAGTLAEGSSLLIELSAVRVRCAECGTESEARSNHLVCAHCGNWRTEVSSGDELVLASVELQRAPAATAAM